VRGILRYLRGGLHLQSLRHLELPRVHRLQTGMRADQRRSMRRSQPLPHRTGLPLRNAAMHPELLAAEPLVPSATHVLHVRHRLLLRLRRLRDGLRIAQIPGRLTCCSETAGRLGSMSGFRS
jgi:hypothetical protein